MVTKVKEVRHSPNVLAAIASEKLSDLKKKRWEQDKAETAIELKVLEKYLALAKEEYSKFLDAADIQDDPYDAGWSGHALAHIEELEGFIDEIVCGSCSEYNHTIDGDNCRCEMSYE